MTDYWKPGKLVDAVLQPNSKFDDFVSKIDDEIKTISELKDAGHVAQATDMMDVVTDTGISTSFKNVTKIKIGETSNLQRQSWRNCMRTSGARQMLLALAWRLSIPSSMSSRPSLAVSEDNAFDYRTHPVADSRLL